MAKKKKSGGKSSTKIDPQATAYAHPYFPHVAAGRETEILAVWASKLTMPALLENFRRLIEDPRGWKKDQKFALLAEVHERLTKLTTVNQALMELGNQYLQFAHAPDTEGTPARQFADEVIKLLDEAFGAANPR